MLNFRQLAIYVVHATVTLAVGVWISYSHIFHQQPAELFFYDHWSRHQLIPESERRILLVDIDEKSIATLGSWPWPRSLTAELVSTLLNHYESAVIGIDIVFPNPTAEDHLLRKVFQDPRVILSQTYDMNTQSVVQVGQLMGQPPSHVRLFSVQSKAFGYVANTPTVLPEVVTVAHITPQIDSDGRLRRMLPILCYELTCSMSLAFEMWQRLQGYQAFTDSLSYQKLGKENQSIWIPYRIHPGNFQYVSAVDVLHKNLAPEPISNLLVVVGSSALGLADRVNTPIGPQVAGMEIHAQILSGLLDDDWRQVYSTPTWFFLTFWLMAGLFFWFWRIHSVLRLALLSIILLLSIIMTWVALSNVYDGYIRVLPWLASYLIFVVMGLFLTGSLWTRQLQHIASQMTHFLPDFLVQKIVQDETILAGSKLASMTVLVADLRGFTQACEGRNPQEAAELAQTCLATMSDVVSRYGGVIEKYTGDGLMAIWGSSPDLQSNHARQAVDAALAMQQSIEQLSPWFVAHHFPEMKLSIGINTGQMAVGYFGGQARLAWSAQGDAVNLANRIEQLTRELGCSLLLGEVTAQALHCENCKDLGYYRVKGRSDPIRIYAWQR